MLFLKKIKNIFKKKYKVSFYYEHDCSGTYFEINDGRIVSKKFDNIKDAYNYVFYIFNKYKDSFNIPDLAIIYKNGKEFEKFDFYLLLKEEKK